MNEELRDECDLCPLDVYASCECGTHLCNHHWHEHHCDGCSPVEEDTKPAGEAP